MAIAQKGMMWAGLRDVEFSGRAWGLFGSPVFSGPLIAAGILSIGIPRKWEFGRWAMLAASLLGLIACSVRGPWVCLVVGWAAITLPKRYAITGAIMATIVLQLYIWRPGAATKEVGRQLAVELAFKAIKKRPIQGTGGDSFGLLYLSMPPKFAARWRESYGVHWQDHSHNSFVEVLMAKGVMGASWALAILLLVLWKAKRGWRLAVLLSTILYSTLNPLALPMKAILAIVAGSLFYGAGTYNKNWVAIPLLLVSLWHWSQELVIRTSRDQRARSFAAANLGLLDRLPNNNKQH